MRHALAVPTALRTTLPAALLVTALAARCAPAEDAALRARAVQLMNGARGLAVLHNTSPYIRTDVTFTGTADDGSVRSGSYTRIRIPGGSLREDLRFGEWQASILTVDRTVSTVGPWQFPPFAVRRLLTLVPFRVGQFDALDVVRAIHDGSAEGQPATCVDYDTVHGEHHSENQLCLSKADGTLLTVREEDRSYEYSHYGRAAGALYPQHLEYHEGNVLSLSVDLKMTELDSVADDTFAPPPGAKSATFCNTSSPPIGQRTPQPEAKGAPDAPVIDVPIALSVQTDGSVADPHLIHPVRPDLDEEALRLVSRWTFQPSTCNGKPNAVPAEVVVHFQGR